MQRKSNTERAEAAQAQGGIVESLFSFSYITLAGLRGLIRFNVFAVMFKNVVMFKSDHGDLDGIHNP